MQRFKKLYRSRLNVAVVLSVILLTAATVLSGTWGLLAIRENSDALIQPLLFESFRLNDISVLGDHSLLIKWPLFFLQSILPYNSLSFILVNLLLSLVTILGIAWITLYVFGKKATVLFSLAMSTLILCSSQFMYFFAWGAVRNIEYTLSILIALFIFKIVVEGLTKRKFLNIAIWLLFVLCVASDSLFLVILTAPAILTLGLLLTLRRAALNSVIASASYIVSATLSGLIVQKAIDNLGIAGTFFDTTSNFKLIDINGIIPSATQSAENVLLLTGGDFYNKHIGILTPLYILCLFISVIGVYWIVSVSKKNINYKKPINLRSFMSVYLSLSAVVLVIAYIATSKAVTLSDVGYIDAASSRYLTLLPIIISIGAAVIISSLRLLKSDKPYLPLIGGVFVVIILCLPALNTQNISLKNNTAQHIEAQKGVVEILSQENVKYALTGYWYSGPVRFWSNEAISSVSVAACNIAEPKFNNRKSWYSEHYTGKDRSAIVIDRSSNGFDRSYWRDCTDENLLKIFGKPAKVINSSNSPVAPTIWIYNSDIRPLINSSNLD